MDNKYINETGAVIGYVAEEIKGDEIRLEGPSRNGVANLFYVQRLPYESGYETDEHFKARVEMALRMLNGEGTLDIEDCEHCKALEIQNRSITNVDGVQS